MFSNAPGVEQTEPGLKRTGFERMSSSIEIPWVENGTKAGRNCTMDEIKKRGPFEPRFDNYNGDELSQFLSVVIRRLCAMFDFHPSHEAARSDERKWRFRARPLICILNVRNRASLKFDLPVNMGSLCDSGG